MDELNYETAIKKAQLVERNPHPNGVDLLDPLRVSMHQHEDILTLAREIQDADKHLKYGTCQKLGVILDQIKMLQAQAIEIIKESNENHLLHSAACNFTKKPGQTYHLYQRSSGQNYFSMLSPEEWNCNLDQKYMGSYRLEHDSSFTPLNKMNERDQKLMWASKCIEKANSNGADTTPMSIEFNVNQNS